jgi:hypothetical protein
MTDDRSDLIERPALRDVDPESGEVRATLTYQGRTVDFSPAAVDAALVRLGRERRNPPDPATRDARLEGYIGPGDPDDVWDVPFLYGSVDLGKRTIYLPFSESTRLANLAAALIERDPRLASLAAWEVHLTYRWGEDLGKEGSGLKLWRLKRPNPDAVWALGQCRPPRATDLLLDLNARVARHAEFTGWQVQAALHEALGCIKLRPGGQFSIEPLSDYWRDFILRRYGVWRPSLRALQEVMAQAEREQLPLWPDDEDGDGDE